MARKFFTQIDATQGIKITPNAGSGKVLTSDNQGVGSWQPAGAVVGSGVRATKSANQDIASGSVVTIAFDGADTFDDAGYHDPVTNNSRLTIPTGLGGLFIVRAQILWQAAAVNGGVAVFIDAQRGASTLRVCTDERQWFNSAGSSAQISVSGIYRMSAGDYFECKVFQSTGANRGIGETDCWFEMARLGS